jgi:hypothetical protein
MSLTWHSPKTGEPMTSEDLRKHYVRLAEREEHLERAHKYMTHPKAFMQKRLEPWLQEKGLTRAEVEAWKPKAAEEEGEEEGEAA